MTREPSLSEDASRLSIGRPQTPTSVAAHERLTRPSAGRGRLLAVASILRAHRPDYWIAVTGWDLIFDITQGAVLAGMDPRAIRSAPDGYTVYRLTD